MKNSVQMHHKLSLNRISKSWIFCREKALKLRISFYFHSQLCIFGRTFHSAFDHVTCFEITIK